MSIVGNSVTQDEWENIRKGLHALLEVSSELKKK